MLILAASLLVIEHNDVRMSNRSRRTRVCCVRTCTLASTSATLHNAQPGPSRYATFFRKVPLDCNGPAKATDWHYEEVRKRATAASSSRSTHATPADLICRYQSAREPGLDQCAYGGLSPVEHFTHTLACKLRLLSPHGVRSSEHSAITPLNSAVRSHHADKLFHVLRVAC